MFNRNYYRSDEYYPSSAQKRKNDFEQPYYRRSYRGNQMRGSRNRRPRSISSSHGSSSVDDEAGHYLGGVGSVIRERYTIIKNLGKGTFGAVYKCKDSKHNDHVAVKVIRSISRYIDSAKIEADILHDVFDKQNASKVNLCVKMYSRFRFQDHYCMVFETLGVSLYDLVKKNDYKRLPMAYVRDIARQLLQALDFLRSINLIHTDLKLENVLFTHNTLKKEEVNHGGKIISVDVPVNPSIKLIDFGGATYENDTSKSRIINTRQYRGPEVTLELGWSFPSDMWSAGCIVAEVYAGDLFFDTHDELEHLALMEHALEDFPRSMSTQSRHGNKYFDRKGLVKISDLPSESRRHVHSMKPLKHFFCLDPADASSGIVELVRGMLRLDHNKRLLPSEALQLPFMATSAGPNSTVPAIPNANTDGVCSAVSSLPIISKNESNRSVDEVEAIATTSPAAAVAAVVSTTALGEEVGEVSGNKRTGSSGIRHENRESLVGAS